MKPLSSVSAATLGGILLIKKLASSDLPSVFLLQSSAVSDGLRLPRKSQIRSLQLNLEAICLAQLTHVKVGVVGLGKTV